MWSGQVRCPPRSDAELVFDEVDVAGLEQLTAHWVVQAVGGRVGRVADEDAGLALGGELVALFLDDVGVGEAPEDAQVRDLGLEAMPGLVRSVVVLPWRTGSGCGSRRRCRTRRSKVRVAAGRRGASRGRGSTVTRFMRSTMPFCRGVYAVERSRRMPRSLSQELTRLETSSGPLSQRRTLTR